jgi:DNA-binding transcriptional LysR family regulator
VGSEMCIRDRYMARNEPEVVQVLARELKVPALPMWLAVHREIRTNPRIRAVYDFMARELPPLI